MTFKTTEYHVPLQCIFFLVNNRVLIVEGYLWEQYSFPLSLFPCIFLVDVFLILLDPL